MKYNISIACDNHQELLDVVLKLGNIAIGAAVEPAPEQINTEVVNDAPAKTAKKKAGKATPPPVIEVEQEMEEVESPYVAPVIDRDALIKKAVELIGVLKKTGLPDNDLMPTVHTVYKAAGCPVEKKISEFTDDQLVRFMPMFEDKVATIAATSKPSTPKSNGFI